MAAVPALQGECGLIDAVLRALLLLTVVSVWLWAGSTATAQPVASGARTLLAAVVDGPGRPIVDLSLDDFVVTEAGQPREVLDAHVADYPLALVLDDRAEVAGSGEFIRSAAKRFIERVGQRPVALFTLASNPAPVTNLDDERRVVVERLDALTFGGAGTASPLETVARAAAVLHESGSPFSAVVVIAAAPVDATALVRGELLPKILESGASVHVVQAQPAQAAQLGVPFDSDLLRVLVEQTRGQFTPIFSPVSYSAALDRLADRLAVEMMVQFLVPPGSTAGDVRVGVRIPGARVVGLGVR